MIKSQISTDLGVKERPVVSRSLQKRLVVGVIAQHDVEPHNHRPTCEVNQIKIRNNLIDSFRGKTEPPSLITDVHDFKPDCAKTWLGL
jgi:hypothetical protein